MAVTFKNEQASLTASLTTLYTAPDNTIAIIEAVTATNTDGAARTIDVHLVPSGDIGGADNIYIDGKSVAAGEDQALDTIIAHNLQPGGSIQALADVTSVVNLRVSVREIS